MKNWFYVAKVKMILLFVAIVVLPIFGLPIAVYCVFAGRRPAVEAIAIYIGLLLTSKYLIFHSIDDCFDFFEDAAKRRYDLVFEKLGL